MSVWLVLGVGLASLCAGLLAVFSWLWVTRLVTSAPGPPTWPLLGNLLYFYRTPVLLDRIGALHKQYGDVFRYYVGPKLVVVVTQPEDIKRVLVTGKQHERDPYFTRLIRITVGDGLLTNSNETWKRHRKLIEPAFHFEAMQTYLDTFNEEGLLLCENLMAAGGAEADVYPVLCLCTLRVLVSTIGGIDFDRLEKDAPAHIRIDTVLFKGLKIISEMLFRPWKTTVCTMWMTFDGRELMRIIEVFKNFTQRYLDLLKEQMFSSKSKERDHWTSLSTDGFLEKAELVNLLHKEILTLAVAGSETTAGSMGYTLALLGLHPVWQEKAQRELDQVFGGGDDYLRPVTVEDLSQLTVIDAIIKQMNVIIESTTVPAVLMEFICRQESLRLFPTAPQTGRVVGEDIPLAGGRYVAPRGCCVIVALFLMHRHPELFPDPDKFDPGRFLPGGSATSRKSGSYLPFSTGPRRCVGGHFATMEMKVLLAILLRRFRIIPGSSREELETIMFSISSHPLTGYRVSFVPREKSSIN